MPRRSIREGEVENWKRILDAYPATAYRMLMVRYMIEDRGLSYSDVGGAAERGKAWVSAALAPSKLRGNDEPWRPNTYPEDAINRKLDIIEGIVDSLAPMPGPSDSEYTEYMEEVKTRRLMDYAEDE